jgi:sterol 3beta-glucosyltransferase
MKVLVMALGTQGDVQPFVALARGLGEAGHEAVLVAPHRFQDFATEHGVRFAGVDDGPMRLMDEANSVVGKVAAGGVRGRIALARRLPATFGQVLDDCWRIASEGADLVVHNGQILAGQHVAERLGVPAVLGLPSPVYVPTNAFPWPGQAMPQQLPTAMNRLTFAGMKAPTAMFGRTVDRWRDSIGLPRRRGRHDPLLQPDGSAAPVLHAFSRHVLPRPADWPDAATVTGYWRLGSAEDTELPAGLAEFLEAGEPPVFVGFGSMSGLDPDGTTRTVITAAKRTGLRVVLAAGWGGLTSMPGDGVFTVRDVPHDLLFPHVAAVVHHGGAGTIGAAVTAGRPQVVCPFVADQTFWGRRMHALGVAPPPIHQTKLTADRLATAIEAAVDRTPAAAALGSLVRGEDGVREAVVRLAGIVAG